MNYRVLGNTGIEVSELAFGTVSLGIPYGIGVNGEHDMPTETEAVKLLQTAVERGINFFDTARDYGCSEERLGKAFKGMRDNVVISTKCKHLYNGDKILPSDKKLVEIMDDSINASLKALQTDYIDLYMLHNSNIEVFTNQTLASKFLKYKQSGKVGAIGVSTYTIEETKMVLESGVWDVVQLAYNLMDQSQGELFALAAEKGIGIVVRSALFKGLLTDKGKNLHPKLEDVEKHLQSYNDLLSANMPTLSDLATKFVLSQKEVSSVLVGIDKVEYLEKALKVADGKYLDKVTLEKARTLGYPEPSFLDLQMWDEKGWLT